MDTTYVNRANNNNLVFHIANQKMDEEGTTRKVISIEEAYRKLKIKAACKTISNNNSNQQTVTFNGNQLGKRTHANRRVGKPRMNWAETTITEILAIRKQTDQIYKYTSFDHGNQQMLNTLQEYAGEHN